MVDCGFVPRCALEDSDSSEARIAKLLRIIRDCGHGLHDISRTELNDQGLPRFNMPLELGVFLGARHYGRGRQRVKRCLILDRDAFRYQQFCSDLAGNDPKAHDDDPRRAVTVVRNWLRDARPGSTLRGGAAIYRRYEAFDSDLPLVCRSLDLDHNLLIFNDLITVIQEWLAKNPA